MLARVQIGPPDSHQAAFHFPGAAGSCAALSRRMAWAALWRRAWLSLEDALEWQDQRKLEPLTHPGGWDLWERLVSIAQRQLIHRVGVCPLLTG